MFKPTIGLEIHIELDTESKMFCNCKNDSDEVKPNKNICPVCTAQPGVLPVINKSAIKKVIKTALALNCQIVKSSFFERKNYFYPDLPKGYQISQYTAPLSRNGYLELMTTKKIRLERIHLEEDTGKLLHPEGKKYSLVDFNRAGVPLMELVTEPDITSSQEAREFIKELQMILRELEVSDANMEKGELRVEVNISLSEERKTKNGKLGTKVEIKNLNSIRAVEKAIEYEIKRQTEILEKHKKVVQETRGWHDKKEITFSQRQKEESHDYRYFPEPDLPPLNLSKEFLQEAKVEIPELPALKRERFKNEYSITDKEIELYVSRKDLGDFFEKAMSELREWVGSEKQEAIIEKEFKKLAKIASNYLCSDLLGLVQDLGVDIKVSAENFAEFVKMIYLKQASSKIAKMVLAEMVKTGRDPSQIIQEKELQQITDILEIEKIVQQVIAQNPKPVRDYKKGKVSALQFLVGQVMSQTKGKANPQKVQAILKKLL